ncbi:hypothetical protein ACI3LY_004663 [Candidozyma auris]|uniref:type II protein arginine methyltransferase n=2 Tax=Candidozyma auris TaxID=498019 RepID=A0AB36VZ72_CANAR|nr:hypothetical protein QG37_07494 [[Candida] auris]PIS48691.1 hypothetical protein B9J08_005393 [[Candida] auris]PIS49303.1 hypothetical protein CJI97_005476 [[Candida] auris]QWW24565.1 hypothetical protein CA7LBN_003422 [[Candida] auris]
MKTRGVAAVNFTNRRSLFQRLKKPFKEEDSGKHHEYSIRPDTFAFKVSSDRSNQTIGATHPLQKDSASESSLNLLEYIYKNATNYPFKNHSPQDVFNRYPLTNAAKMGRLKTRPRKAKMLVSDFIEDSLYNPSYGYFSQEVEIFHNDKPFNYNEIQDVDEFMEVWKKAYSKYDELNTDANNVRNERKVEPPPSTAKATSSSKALISSKDMRASPTSKFARAAQTVHRQDLVAAGGLSETKRSHQLWHTPTELFSPHYGEALARYIVVNYKLNGHYPYDDLLIYEMGGGNGTLMCNILNFIKQNEPDIYNRTQYKIIEISDQLALKQYSQALGQKLLSQGLDQKKVQIINKSIFKWDKVIHDPCFFIALEVFDNFAHDLVRYDITTGQPHQGYVLVDDAGDFYEFFTPELTHYTEAYLGLRENGRFPVLAQSKTMAGKLMSLKSALPFVNEGSVHPLLHSNFKMSIKDKLLPFKDHLTPGEFIPTRLLQFFQILKHRFPNHTLISSDFNALPNTINGHYNAPVVQTVIKDRMVDVSTYMVHQGFFDIMFPTDFALASEMYKQITGKLARVESHKEFLSQWADVDAVTTLKGENPMLDFYKNVSFMVS